MGVITGLIGGLAVCCCGFCDCVLDDVHRRRPSIHLPLYHLIHPRAQTNHLPERLRLFVNCDASAPALSHCFLRRNARTTFSRPSVQGLASVSGRRFRPSSAMQSVGTVAGPLLPLFARVTSLLPQAVDQARAQNGAAGTPSDEFEVPKVRRQHRGSTVWAPSSPKTVDCSQSPSPVRKHKRSEADQPTVRVKVQDTSASPNRVRKQVSHRQHCPLRAVSRYVVRRPAADAQGALT